MKIKRQVLTKSRKQGGNTFFRPELLFTSIDLNL
jgi:hypothetical protein